MSTATGVASSAATSRLSSSGSDATATGVLATSASVVLVGVVSTLTATGVLGVGLTAGLIALDPGAGIGVASLGLQATLGVAVPPFAAGGWSPDGGGAGVGR